MKENCKALVLAADALNYIKVYDWLTDIWNCRTQLLPHLKVAKFSTRALFDYLKILNMMESQNRNNLWRVLQGRGGPGRRHQLQDILRVPHLQGGRGQGEADQLEASFCRDSQSEPGVCRWWTCSAPPAWSTARRRSCVPSPRCRRRTARQIWTPGTTSSSTCSGMRKRTRKDRCLKRMGTHRGKLQDLCLTSEHKKIKWRETGDRKIWRRKNQIRITICLEN